MNKKLRGIVPHEVPSIPNQPFGKTAGQTGKSTVKPFEPNYKCMNKLGKK